MQIITQEQYFQLLKKKVHVAKFVILLFIGWAIIFIGCLMSFKNINQAALVSVAILGAVVVVVFTAPRWLVDLLHPPEPAEEPEEADE